MFAKIKLRDPQTDPPPMNHTEAVWRYKDGETYVGEAQYMYMVVPSKQAQDMFQLDPGIEWWFDANSLEVHEE